MSIRLRKNGAGGHLDPDRAALVLIRRFGNDCAVVAWKRAVSCERRGDPASAAEWRHVLRRVIHMQFRPSTGALH